MTHPTEEQWMAYLYGELERKSHAALAGHLHSCPECRTRVTAWSAAKEMLDGWRLSESRAARTNLRPWVKWGVAAALLLAAGVATGRLTIRDRSRAALTSSEGGGSGELASLRAGLREDPRKQMERQTEELVTATVVTTRYETLRLLAAFAETYELARFQDRQMLAEVLGQLQSRYVTEHAALRNGLDILASLTDEELLRMEQEMVQMLGRQALAGPVAEVQNVSLPSDTRSPQ